MKAPNRLALAVLGLVTGCAVIAHDGGNRYSGHYVLIKGGFNESLTIDLAANHSYKLDHELVSCVADADGKLVATDSEEIGRWSLNDGIIELEPQSRTKGFPTEAVFIPAFSRRLRPYSDGTDQLLVDAGTSVHLVLKKANMPNQPSEPALSSVTPPAGQESRPR